MDPQIITELLKGMRLEVVWTLVMSALTFYILIAIKDFLITILTYFKFRSNEYIAIGKLVQVNGFDGRIKDIGFSYIVLEGEEGYYRIPMIRWQYEKWIFPRTERKRKNKYDGQRLGLRDDDDVKIDRNSKEYQNMVKNQKE